MPSNDVCMNCENCPFLDPNIPHNLHEIHVTIDFPQGADDIKHAADIFRKACEENNWKAIILDLSVAKDAMATTTFIGDPKDAHQEALRVARILTRAGFRVVRQKIETTLNNTMSRLAINQNYYESHFAIKVNEAFDPALLKAYVHGTGAHVSRNLFKEDVQMVTVRSYDCSRTWHLHKVHELESGLTKYKFEILKIINEFCWHDTNVAHDNKWVNQTLKEY